MNSLMRNDLLISKLTLVSTSLLFYKEVLVLFDDKHSDIYSSPLNFAVIIKKNLNYS